MMYSAIIPLPHYTPIFYNVLLGIILFAFLKLMVKGYTLNTSSAKEYISFLLLIVVVLYMGLRPISFAFGDMGIYNKYFNEFANGYEITNYKDYSWRLFMKFCSGIMSAKQFFYCVLFYT